MKTLTIISTAVMLAITPAAASAKSTWTVAPTVTVEKSTWTATPDRSSWGGEVDGAEG